MLPPWKKAEAKLFTEEIIGAIHGLKPAKSLAIALANIPTLAEVAVRFYNHLDENIENGSDFLEFAMQINGALHNYLPNNLSRCGYYEIDSIVDHLQTVSHVSSTEEKINRNTAIHPKVRGIELNRENLLRILRYEKDEEYRKEAYTAAVEAHPENAALFKQVLAERIAAGLPKRRSICENPTDFLEKYAKELPHDGRAAWNWAFVGEPEYKDSRRAVDDALKDIARVFGIEFYPVKLDLWAEMPAVEVADTGRVVILDLWNRPGKTRRVPFTLSLGSALIVVCYFDEKIDRFDLVTFYHEMGHALHFAYTRLRTLLAQASIEEDFGEIPGVLMEYIAEPNINRNILIGRQVALGLFDQYVHRGESPELAAKAAFAHWLPGGAGHYWQSFEHYTMGYGNSYYSYALAYWYASKLEPIVRRNPGAWLALLGRIGQKPARHLLDKFIKKYG